MRIDVPKERLRETLTENRAKHRDIFERAWEGYCEAARKELEERLEAVKDRKPFNLHIGLVVPEDHTDDYDRAVGMVDWAVGNTIPLTDVEYRQYIDDDWGWKRQFVATSVGYIGEHGEMP